MILTLLKNTIVSRESLLGKNLYTPYVRPNLEYVSAVWTPYTKEDTRTLEKVPRRTTRVIKRLEGFNYELRLLNLGETT